MFIILFALLNSTYPIHPKKSMIAMIKYFISLYLENINCLIVVEEIYLFLLQEKELKLPSLIKN